MRQWIERLWPVVPVLAALVFVVILLVLFGADPAEALEAILNGAFGTQDKILSVAAFWVPLFLASIGLLITFTAGLWNIGVEGQIIVGSIGASFIALNVEAPSYILIPLEIL